MTVSPGLMPALAAFPPAATFCRSKGARRGERVRERCSEKAGCPQKVPAEVEKDSPPRHRQKHAAWRIEREYASTVSARHDAPGSSERVKASDGMCDQLSREKRGTHGNDNTAVPALLLAEGEAEGLVHGDLQLGIGPRQLASPKRTSNARGIRTAFRGLRIAGKAAGIARRPRRSAGLQSVLYPPFLVWAQCDSSSS